MRTVGVDLAAEPPTTAVVTIEWSPRGGRVTDVLLGADDEQILAAVPSADAVGVDCPLGWPDRFVDFVVAHRAGSVPPSDLTGLPLRRTLLRRATDAHVAATSGVVPMSVSGDRIGSVAMRAAGLLAALDAGGEPVDRSGSGVVMEVYPAVALKAWGLPHRSYKGVHNTGMLKSIVDAIAIDWGGSAELARASDHVLDATICALIARAARLGRTALPPEELLPLARSEGWIHVPTCSLAELLSS